MAAARLKPLAEKLDGFDDHQKGTLRAGLLNFAILVGDEEQIESLSQLLAEKDRGNLQLHSLRFDHAYNTGNVATMEKVVPKDIHEVEGNGPVWLHGQAAPRSRQFAAGGKPELLDEALTLLQQWRGFSRGRRFR